MKLAVSKRTLRTTAASSAILTQEEYGVGRHLFAFHRYLLAPARLGNTQSLRGKWQVYPPGLRTK